MSAIRRHTRNFGLTHKSATLQNGVAPGSANGRKSEVWLGLLVAGELATVVLLLVLSTLLALLAWTVFSSIRLASALARLSWVKEGQKRLQGRSVWERARLELKPAGNNASS
jgi:hypothetical protein